MRKMHAFFKSVDFHGIVLKEKLPEIVKMQTDTVNMSSLVSSQLCSCVQLHR